VYAQSRKICGILVETSTAAASRVVVGVGINVNNRLERAPAELRQRATSLIEITGYPIPLVTALTSVLQQIEGHLAWLREGAGELPQRWDAHCMLTGHRVEVATGSRRTSGTCRGIDRHGALLVETTDGITACSSGAVLSWQ
jgi:BirA family biotin operon repressor/biotin-[acetyl-CoA-carboxylase] ligase